jgi:hypothetical protein
MGREEIMADPDVAAAPPRDRALHEASSERDMVFIPGGTFRMGS